MRRTHNVLHIAMPLELLPCKEARLTPRLGVVDSASASNNCPVERQHSGSLEKLHLVSALIRATVSI